METAVADQIKVHLENNNHYRIVWRIGYPECGSYIIFFLMCEATPLMTTQSGAEQRPLGRSPVDRRHSIAEMAAGSTRCLVPELCRVDLSEPPLNLSSVYDGR